VLRYTLLVALKDAFLPEFDHEMGTTRRLFERVPAADFDWAPHAKSYTLGQLVTHIANIPHWAQITCETSEYDAAAAGDLVRPVVPGSVAELIKRFDSHVAGARARLNEQTDASIAAPWTLKQGTHEIFTMPKSAVLRGFVLNHLVHHRGQLTVYLRLRDVPLPAIYGPTADE
jgi:uncharacterized damage-inducible protein DinB